MILEKEGKKKKESKKSRARQGGTADMCPRLAREKHRSSAGMLCSSKHRAKWARRKVFPLGKSHHANIVVVRRGCTASQPSVSLLVNKAVSPTACVILSSFFFLGWRCHLTCRDEGEKSRQLLSFLFQEDRFRGSPEYEVDSWCCATSLIGRGVITAHFFYLSPPLSSPLPMELFLFFFFFSTKFLFLACAESDM